MYRRSPQSWMKHLDFMLLDLICLQMAFIAAYFIRHGFENPYLVLVYRNMAVAVSFISMAVAIFFETFKNVLKRGYYVELAITIKHVFFVEILAVFYLFTMKEGEAYSRVTLYTMGILYAVLTYGVRLLWKKVLKSRRLDREERSLLIITTDSIAPQVIQNVRQNNYAIFNIAGLVIYDKNRQGENIAGIPVVSCAENVADYVCKTWIDEVFVNFAPDVPLSKTLMSQLTETGVTVHLNLARAVEDFGKKQMIERIGNYTVLTTCINYATMRQACMKRAFDILGGLFGCIVTGILFFFIAPAIYIHSPGPIFFSQVRVGKNGKKFKMYKFRSMYLDAEARKQELLKQNRVKDGMMFKLDFDPRVIGNRVLSDGRRKTGIGEFIRRTSLDEFPQFWNVLKGDMSLVGTRPPTVDEFVQYKLHHRARLATKPGITGMWQVSGRSNITDFEEVVKLDKQYISEWSMGLDLRILLKTFGVVLRKDGSM